MTVQLTAPRKAVRFTLMTSKTTTMLTDNNTNSWTGTLPETGDYIILVEGNGTKGSTYSITISIK